MAYIVNQQQEEETQQQANTGSVGGTAGAPTAPTGQLLQQPTQPKRTAFTNIQQFLQANQPGGQNIANRFGAQLSQSTQQATSGIQDVRGTVQKTGETQQKVVSTGQQIKQAVQQARQTLTSDPYAQTNQLLQLTPEQQAEFSRVAQGDTTEAEQLKNQFTQQASGLQSNLNVQQNVLGSGLGDARFRSQLMQRAIRGGPSYTLGMRALDTLVGEGVGGQQIGQQFIQNLGQVGQTGQELVEKTGAQQQNLQNLLTTIKQEYDTLGQLFGETTTAIQQQGAQRLRKLEDELKEFDTFADRLGRGEVSVAEINQLLTLPPDKQPAWLKALGTVQLAENEVPLLANRFDWRGQFADQNQYASTLSRELNSLLRGVNHYYLASAFDKDFDGSLDKMRAFSNPILRESLRALYFENPEFNRKLKEFQQVSEEKQDLMLGKRTDIPPQDRQKRINELLKQQIQLRDDLNVLALQNAANWGSLRAAKPDERAYQEALANKFLSERLGVKAGQKTFGANVGEALRSAIDRQNLQDRVMTSQEVATMNVLRRLREGDQAPQLSLENRNLALQGLLNPQQFNQKVQQAIQNQEQRLLQKLREVGPLRATGEDRAEGFVRLDKEFNPYEWYTGNRNLRVIEDSKREGWGEALFGAAKTTSGNWSKAKENARQQAERMYEDLMRSLGFMDTLRLR